MKLDARPSQDSVTAGVSSLMKPVFLWEMLFTLLSAVLTGLSASLLLILLVFGWTSVQAETGSPTSGRLSLHALDGRLLQQAPLLDTQVSTYVSGLLARVRVEQQFSNPTGEWMEGIYQFPLPEDSAVDQLRMVIGERIIEGRIAEKAQAKRTYEKAKASGQRASLLSQQRPNIFSTSVANIAPGEHVRVVIEYQQTILYEKGRYEWRFPLVIGPRYIPGTPLVAAASSTLSGGSVDTDQVPDASRITPPVLDPAEGQINPVAIEVSLDAGMPVTEIISQYHPVIEHRDIQGTVNLRLAEGEVPADRDFLLSWRAPVGMYPKTAVFTESWKNEAYAMLMVMPPDQEHESQRLSREMMFVVDSSGSMHGASMTQAKAALRLAMSRLREDDTFNLIHFSNQSHALFPQARSGSKANRLKAMRFVDGLRAEGGTEMMPALRMALKGGDAGGRLRQVVFLTDGSVGNETALFELIRRQLGESRLFTIGIGSAPNSFFMRRAAEFGRGSFTYIGDLGEVESRMLALFNKLEHPAMSDIHIEWEGQAPLEILPARIPDLYLGEPLLVVVKSESLDGEMLIQGDRDGTVWRHRVDWPSKKTHEGLHKLWARQQIKSLMSSTVGGESVEVRRQQVLQLALRHQLVSAYTSLIAVERQPVRPLSAPLKGGPVPLNLPVGWDANHVFGSLPQTATYGPLSLLTGLLLMLAALWLQRRKAS
ncbi:MAG: marine proteobacterial sortase target protein [Candidatus Thiodiazotropha sp. (ex Myrtea sp. 'scaly one' KF741663)]|nr:marine proteobacterial sortase target protein [Candidatus Thiodiazotropha sp. (ex Myrtea sp. 'scaly one' KF741663)]